MALKNRTSDSKGTFDKIQKILAEHGARKVMFNYGDNGQIEGITFSIMIGEKECGFKLPALVGNVRQILYKNVKPYSTWDSRHEAQKKSWDEQAYKTAWANIRDWIDAQMAMVDTQQVKVEQVFLPYLIVNQGGQTLFEQMEKNQFLLGSGE